MCTNRLLKSRGRFTHNLPKTKDLCTKKIFVHKSPLEFERASCAQSGSRCAHLAPRRRPRRPSRRSPNFTHKKFFVHNACGHPPPLRNMYAQVLMRTLLKIVHNSCGPPEPAKSPPGGDLHSPAAAPLRKIYARVLKETPLKIVHISRAQPPPPRSARFTHRF